MDDKYVKPLIYFVLGLFLLIATLYFISCPEKCDDGYRFYKEGNYESAVNAYVSDNCIDSAVVVLNRLLLNVKWKSDKDWDALIKSKTVLQNVLSDAKIQFDTRIGGTSREMTINTLLEYWQGFADPGFKLKFITDSMEIDNGKIIKIRALLEL